MAGTEGETEDASVGDASGGPGGDAGEAGEGGETGPGPGEGIPEECEGVVIPDFAPLRRITRAQFENSVRDLLGTATDPGDAFPRATRSDGYSGDASVNVVTEFGAQGIFDAAVHVSAQAVTDLDTLLPCAPADLDADCASEFIADFGRRAFRRPLAGNELTIFDDLFASLPSDATSEEQVGTLLEAFLQSPQFLYITQGGGQDTEVQGPDGEALLRLTDWEIAARLSYLLWDTTPSDTLLDLAAAGNLHEPEDIAAQAAAMLDDPRADRALSRFHNEWLTIENVPSSDKDTDVFPGFDPALAAAMLEESRRFAVATVRRDGTFADLLTNRDTEVNAALASHYGISSGTPGADGFGAATLPAERPGILGQAAFLTAHSHVRDSGPVLRGAFVQKQLLCANIPPQPSGSQTTRDVLEMHRADPSCAGCHNRIDPPGLAFENFDAIGRWRDTESGQPIDASGELFADRDSLGEFEDAAQMIGLLADAPAAQACYSTQWLHYAQGAAPSPAEACAVATLGTEFVNSGGSIRELLIHLATTDAFRYRVAPQND